MWALSSALLHNSVLAQEAGNLYIIGNEQVRITTDSDEPLIREYVLKESEAVLQGNTRGLSPEVLVYRGASATDSNSTKVSYRSRKTGNNNETEHENFYLIHVILPDLVAVGGNDNGPKLAIPAEAEKTKCNIAINQASWKKDRI